MTGAGTEDKFAEDWSETSRAEKELKPDKAEELKLDKLPQKIEIINKKHKKSQTKKPVRKKPGNDAGGSKNGKKQEEGNKFKIRFINNIFILSLVIFLFNDLFLATLIKLIQN